MRFWKPLGIWLSGIGGGEEEEEEVQVYHVILEDDWLTGLLGGLCPESPERFLSFIPSPHPLRKWQNIALTKSFLVPSIKNYHHTP